MRSVRDVFVLTRESLISPFRIIGSDEDEEMAWRFKKTQFVNTVWGAKVNTGFLCGLLFPVKTVISRTALFCVC